MLRLWGFVLDRKFTVSNTSWRTKACLQFHWGSNAGGKQRRARFTLHHTKAQTVHQQDYCVETSERKGCEVQFDSKYIFFRGSSDQHLHFLGVWVRIKAEWGKNKKSVGGSLLCTEDFQQQQIMIFNLLRNKCADFSTLQQCGTFFITGAHSLNWFSMPTLWGSPSSEFGHRTWLLGPEIHLTSCKLQTTANCPHYLCLLADCSVRFLFSHIAFINLKQAQSRAAVIMMASQHAAPAAGAWIKVE